MHDNLRTLASFPLTQPYDLPPYNYSGTEQILPQVLQVSGDNAIVDWVLVELRDGATPGMIVTRKAALIQRDGDVVELDGISDLHFNGIPAGDHRLAVRHRNHLGILTDIPYHLNAIATPIDLTLASTATMGANSRKNINGVMTLWGGNANGDQSLRYYGSNSDRQSILNMVGSSTPYSMINDTYTPADVNMDGILNYYGTNSDRQFLLNNVGSAAPYNVLEVPLE
jgi:hypothetical protein